MSGRFVYHNAPSDEETRCSIRRFGLLPNLPATSGHSWGWALEGQRRGVYVTTKCPMPELTLDLYRIELPSGLHTDRDRFESPGLGETLVIPCRIPPTWMALVFEAPLEGGRL